MEENLKTLLKSVAKPLKIPVIDDELPGDVLPCITFHFFGESGALFGSGKAAEETGSVQVDIWYKSKTSDVLSVIDGIKAAINGKSTYTYPEKSYIYETGNKIHHTYFTFDLIKESEV